MRPLKTFGRLFWRFMVIFSFIVNVVLVLVVLVLGLTIFDIKRNIAQPLLEGLHSSFVGLDNSTIDWTIPVRTSIPLNTSIPLQTDTSVVLTDNVSLAVTANITLPGVGQLNNAVVFLSLPRDTVLPVRLDLSVPVNLDVPVSLDVRAVIPVNQTQLHDPIANLRLLFEPLVRVLGNLPENLGDVGPLIGGVLSGNVNLLAETDYSRNPWPGYSITAGMNYNLGTEPMPLTNVPVITGVVIPGGIPALDEGLRPEIYHAGGPGAINQQAYVNMDARGIPVESFDGRYAETAGSPRKQAELGSAVPPVNNPESEPTPVPPAEGQPPPDLGIISTTAP